MKPILKWLAMLMLVVGIHSFSYARETAANDGKLKKGEQVDLSAQKVVWQKGDTTVVQTGDRYYYVKTDDLGHAIVIKRVHDLATFTSDAHYYSSNVAIGGYWAPGFGFHPYYPYRSVVFIRQPIIVHRGGGNHPNGGTSAGRR